MVKNWVFHELSTAIHDIFENWKVISAMLCMQNYATKVDLARPRAPPTHQGVQEKILISTLGFEKIRKYSPGQKTLNIINC